MSKVTKKDIAKSFNVSLDNVEQVQSKQLFIVYTSNAKLLVSYYTVIGVYEFNHCAWYITKEKYSTTTSRQITTFRNSIANPVIFIEANEFSKLVNS